MGTIMYNLRDNLYLKIKNNHVLKFLIACKIEWLNNDKKKKLISN